MDNPGLGKTGQELLLLDSLAAGCCYLDSLRQTGRWSCCFLDSLAAGLELHCLLTLPTPGSSFIVWDNDSS
ncbi:hypothetical protein FRX31_020760 [Thalictrum thalictroides]|uniref:Uncharacterized protein n=1 Tax=Thalictrum thalictroides TaxID=46969 RepID=A0A7J6W004_THATH|nr:hypothetical protein FRX31_020760 [Thalictrum thalictroides]